MYYYWLHIFACIWFWIGSQSNNNWIQKNQLETKIWYEQYLFAYYFVVITMNTVGYGFYNLNFINFILFLK